MKDWIRKWLGIKEIQTVYGLRLDGHRADLDEMRRELRKHRCYEGGEEVPKTAVLYEVVQGLVAVIDYLDIEFYTEQKVDESYAPPRPRLIEVRKARKKQPSNSHTTMKKSIWVIKEEWSGYAVENSYGSRWSDKTFETVDEAKRYMTEFKKDFDHLDLSKHKVVPVRIITMKKSPTL